MIYGDIGSGYHQNKVLLHWVLCLLLVVYRNAEMGGKL